MAARKHLLEPLAIGPVRLPCRIVSSSHQTTLVEDHLPTDEFVAYQEARARGGAGLPYVRPTMRTMRKTSVYLAPEQVERLARLAAEEGMTQAEILRQAIDAYQPARAQNRDFALAAGFARIDTDERPISQIPEHELLGGFGA